MFGHVVKEFLIKYRTSTKTKAYKKKITATEINK